MLTKCLAGVPKPGHLFLIGVLVVAIGLIGFRATYRSGNPIFPKVAFGVAVTGWAICGIALGWGLVSAARY